MFITGLARPLRAHQMIVLGGLACLTAISWIVLVVQARSMSGMSADLTMGMNAALFLAVWIVMMAAMMFPAAAPMVLAFAKVQDGRRSAGYQAVSTWLFVASYLAVWALIGILAYGVALGAGDLGRSASWVGGNGPRLGGVLLVAAGIYQLSPLKGVCLRKCRSPLSFILGSWEDGPRGAVRMGAKHALFCVGCCWLLFAVLFPLGMMNIALLAALTLVIFAEKSLRYGDRLAWAAALPLIAYGIAVVVAPGFLPMQPPHNAMPM